MAFLNEFILCENGLKKDSHLWLRVYRDTLADALNFEDPADAQSKPALPKGTRVQLFGAAHAKALTIIITKQNQYCGEFMKIRATNPQQRMTNGHKLFVAQLMEISTKNSDRVIRALNSYRPLQRPSPPTRTRASIYDEDDSVVDDIQSYAPSSL